MSNLSKRSVSLIIPAKDEERRLEATLASWHEWLVARYSEFELIVVDDGSTDGTVDLVNSWHQRDPRISVDSLGANYGKGRAVRHGLQRAQGEYLLYTDADLPVPPPMADLFFAELESGAALVMASQPSSYTKGAPLLRRFLSWAFRSTVRLLLLHRNLDTQRGFKVMRREHMSFLFPLLQIDSFAFDVELIYLALVYGLDVRQLSVQMIHRPGSKVQIVRHGLQMLRDIWRIKRTAVPPDPRSPD